MTDFEADDVVALGYGIQLRSVDVNGQAGDPRPSPLEGGPVRSVEPGDPTAFLADAGSPAADELGPAILRSGMRLRVTIPFDDLVSPLDQPVERSRAATDLPHLEIEVEAPENTDEGQLILEVDGTGYVRWHHPRDAEHANSPQRGPTTQVFDIPVDRWEPPGEAGHGADRGVVGFGVRKVLHLIRFPIEKAAELVVHHAVRWWEERRRPHRLCMLNPDGTFTPGVDAHRLAAVGDRPLLLFVHGTFSTGNAFGKLYADQPWLTSTCEQYGAALVFEHPTMHMTPEDNARWLLGQLPTDRRLTLDVVSHSRGGLVARQLPLQTDVARPPCVRRLVQVAAPNAGTVLASEKRLHDMLDAFTNLLALFPDGSGVTTLEAVLEVVKQVARGSRRGLPGLTAMDPDSTSLRRLNDSASAIEAVDVIGSDYRPLPSAGPAAWALDTVVDRLFKQANDLVVPTAGMSQAGVFSVARPFLLRQESGIAHTTYFGSGDVRAEIAQRLVPR